MKLNNEFEHLKITNVKVLTLLAILVALTVSGRLLFSFIPNVQPVTTLVILVTLLIGFRYGVIFASLVMLVSNLFLGLGIWTIGQMIGYACIAALTALVIRPVFSQLPFWLLVVYAAFTGFLYGFIQALCMAPFYGFHYFLVYYVSGLSFDMLHAVGNALFYIVLAPILLPLLDKWLIKYT
ncbi:ECF transporter S component [Listeria fleischmannii]|uniref:ECF transporter S component n=1 Tax=Listeria fleischmannii TaxID=1069827 RepID=UPI00162A842A|nr:ECF transporter S component [Listeria fleischmannii]MBC1419382.1 ECF transporter S component [Listeria fleischmannii]